MDKKEHKLKAAALAYINHKYFQSSEYKEIVDYGDFDTALEKSEEIRQKLATKYGVSKEDMLRYLIDNPQPINWSRGIGNNDDGD